MIKNERQYRITKNQADRFSQTLDVLRQRRRETGGSASPYRQGARGCPEKPTDGP